MPNSNDGSRSRSGSAEEPIAKRARKLTEADLGGPIEDEETAKQKLRDAGFNPNDLTSERVVDSPDDDGQWFATPMAHFCAAGDLKMARYLLSKGIPTVRPVRADTSNGDDDDEEPNSPLEGALWMGKVHVCEWLFAHGAREEVEKNAYNLGGDNLLRIALGPWKAGRGSSTPQWLILNGALSNRDGSPNKEATEALESYRGAESDYRRLLSWAKESLQTNRNVHLILLGSLLLQREFSIPALRQRLRGEMKSSEAADFMINELSAEKCKVLWEKLLSSPLQMLGGTTGIFELIADFAGIIRGKHMVSTLQGILGPLEKALGRAEDGYIPYP